MFIRGNMIYEHYVEDMQLPIFVPSLDCHPHAHFHQENACLCIVRWTINFLCEAEVNVTLWPPHALNKSHRTCDEEKTILSTLHHPLWTIVIDP